jgi:hypothetical protein
MYKGSFLFNLPFAVYPVLVKSGIEETTVRVG